jgi:putative NADH-flavin reductase
MVTLTKTPLRLFAIGATGGIGRALLDQALERGHQVTAFVRSPAKLGAPRTGLTVRQGDPCSVGELEAAVPGHDAVLSTIGPPGPGPSMIVSKCARSTVAAMLATDVRRLMIVSAAVLFRDEGILFAILRRTLLRNVAEDQTEMERVVTASVLDWTIVRPPRLTNGPLTKRYQIEDNRMPRPRLPVSRADVAHFLLDEVEQGAHRNRMVGMAGSRA